MIRLTLTAAATLLIGFSLANVSLAQNTGSAGLFGNRNVGAGSINAGQRNFGSNRTTGDSSGDVASGERFSRENRQGRFVGSDSGDLQSFLSQAASGGLGGRGPNAAGGRGGQQAGRNFNQGGQQRKPRLVRATLRVAFSYPQRSTAAASTKLAQRINVSRSIQPVVPVEVTISNRTATLRGVVATAADRDLAVRLVLLEPGISRVENELTVASSDEQPDPTPRP
ncbi:MAG: BON domain-containing protein [Planctomycetes bacterium]|nr:BON domain-containing protein [Planctomycetota bacterium]